MRILERGFTILLFLVVSVPLIADEPSKQPWLKYWREATVALGRVVEIRNVLPDGTVSQRESFTVVGTGVLLTLPEDESKTPWLVTAKHVFFDPEKNWDPEVIHLRFAWFDNKPLDEYFGIEIRLKENNERLWFEHPTNTVDLATIPLRIKSTVAEREAVPSVPLDNFVTTEDVYEGASVFILGYPTAVGPQFLTRSLLRSGVIAWTSPENPAQELIIIDAQMFATSQKPPTGDMPLWTSLRWPKPAARSSNAAR